MILVSYTSHDLGLFSFVVVLINFRISFIRKYYLEFLFVLGSFNFTGMILLLGLSRLCS